MFCVRPAHCRHRLHPWVSDIERAFCRGGCHPQRRVVSSIILIAVFDGVFSVVYFLSGHMNETVINVRHLYAGYNNNAIMEDLNFDIQSGEVFVILGGSGCGKSTRTQAYDRPGAAGVRAKFSSRARTWSPPGERSATGCCAPSG